MENLGSFPKFSQSYTLKETPWSLFFCTKSQSRGVLFGVRVLCPEILEVQKSGKTAGKTVALPQSVF